MYLGIDLGTSGIKAVIVNDNGSIVATGNAPLEVSRPHPTWSEQDPDDWWLASCAAIANLPADLRLQVRAIGLSGQMHGAVFLGEDRQTLRPAILWNDGRSSDQCAQLEALVPELAGITGNRAMPGFTAPKVLWLAQNEPEIAAKTKMILLPKDWLRMKMTGICASDVSDAAGTLWLDVAKRDWSDVVLPATGLSRAHMPLLIEGNQICGRLQVDVAHIWGLPVDIPVAGGAGDNAASAIGIGVVQPGQGFLSLGTSGVIFVTAPDYEPNPAQGVHTFCHALPNQWHWMSVILSAASAIDWAVSRAGFPSIERALHAVKEDPIGKIPVFVPYLSGERTPHNDPFVKGAVIGLTHQTTRADIVRAALEGVAFAFGDGFETLKTVGTMPSLLTCVGGGSRIEPLMPILASVLDVRLLLVEGGESAAALGAAHLGRMCLTGEAAQNVCKPLHTHKIIEPDPRLVESLLPRQKAYRALYPAIKDFTV